MCEGTSPWDQSHKFKLVGPVSEIKIRSLRLDFRRKLAVHTEGVSPLDQPL